MLNSWPTFWFYVLAMLLLVEFRAVAARPVVGVGRLLLFFSFGAIGAGVSNLVIQRIAFAAMSGDTAGWVVGPASEELLKALPVALIAYVFAERRRLGIADYTLIAFSTGLGFNFVEGNLRALVDGQIDPGYRWWLPVTSTLEKSNYLTAGHALWTAFIGLGIGIGMRVWPRSPLRFVPAVAAFTLSWFEHAMNNWKGTHVDSFFGEIEGYTRAPGWIESLYAVDLHGRLVLILLPTLLVAGLIGEALWCGRRVTVPRHLMLPDEGLSPFIPMEWIALVRAARRGRHELSRTARYLRRRRELVLAIAELRRAPDDEELVRSVRYLRDRVGHEREELTVPLPNRWLPAPSQIDRSFTTFMRKYWAIVLSFALVVVRFGIAPHAAGTSQLSARWFAALSIVFAVLFFARRLRLFQRVPRPQLAASDGESLVAYHTRGLLLCASATSLGCSLFAFFSSVHAVAPHTGSFISYAFGSWAAAGGGAAGASTLAAAGAAAAAALADPRPPDTCAPLAAEADAAGDRMAAVRSLLSGGAA